MSDHEKSYGASVGLAWEELEAQPVAHGRWVHRELESNSGLKLGLSIDSDGLRRLYVRVDDLRNVTGLTTRGLRVTGDRIPFEDGTTGPGALVACLNPDLHNRFTDLGARVLAELTQEEPSHHTITRVIEEYREMFDRESPRGLSKEKRVGLFGELLYVRELVGRSPGALNYWTANLHGTPYRHDFSVPGVAIEVKTSTKQSGGRSHQISGIGQLLAPADAELYLASTRLLQVPHGGDTLPALVATVKGLPEINDATFTERLETYGYYDEHQQEYAHEHYHPVETLLYRVDDDFPRFTVDSFPEGRLPAGIRELKYEIDLTGAPAPLTPHERAAILDRFAECVP